MNIETIKSVYFVGAGGIGMSALVRYFLSKGKVVAGYDRTPTPLTENLIAEGAQIHYEENVRLIPEACKDKESTLVVLTPAVPQEHEELVYFRNNGFEIQKRAQVLGTITHSSKGLCVAGTHGKEYFFKTKEEFEEICNRSIQETFTRTIYTTVTTLLPVIILIALGSRGIFTFNMAMLFGLLSGTYSSIFIATVIYMAFEKKNLGKMCLQKFIKR